MAEFRRFLANLTKFRIFSNFFKFFQIFSNFFKFFQKNVRLRSGSVQKVVSGKKIVCGSKKSSHPPA